MSKKTEKPEQKAEKPKQPVVKAAVKAVESTIYAGPNVPGGGLSQFSVFKNGILAPHIKQIIARFPAIKRLIVPVSKLAAVQSKLADQTSAEHAQFQACLEEFKKGEQ